MQEDTPGRQPAGGAQDQPAGTVAPHPQADAVAHGPYPAGGGRRQHGDAEDGVWPLVWPQGRADLRAVGGALQRLRLTLPSGRVAQPFAQAPWPAAGVAGHLAHLGGEWPCVPFGSGTVDPAHHGYGSDHVWRLDGLGQGGARMSIDYPAGHPVARLEREVRTRPDGVDLTLAVHVRQDCALPLGLHPILAWPEGGIRIRHAGPAQGRVFPRVFEPGVSRLAPGAAFDSLSAVPLAAGGTADLAHTPGALAEELVQVHGGAPSIEVDYLSEGLRLRLDWDGTAFPSFLMWLSNGGRTGTPWGGRFHGIGIEPCAAAFDDTTLAPHVPGGRPVAVTLSAGTVWRTAYGLTLTDLPDA
ncbi:hypothetical protein EKE94_17855 [Mesobaculum littorinae]|uniref:Aldose 1-epimerase n=1 Tax=Mesobaculum littorinae TaxID=2486419 RepID=A0A438AD25_9RHOB|nr:hypothetical protein [Mesobaculum littorinae]RVV96590.1 hypothetical protein EKE94_17855 [Mesobaculum littorinae]